MLKIKRRLIMNKIQGIYILKGELIFPDSTLMYAGDEVEIIAVEEENDIVKLRKKGSTCKGTYTYISSFYDYFSKPINGNNDWGAY